ncbi:hypothetical protein C0Q70_21104 [Pomacea canaliculata]|uniref:G-protein coupled receptors family 1 profile domain-containing protein n=1 Tax=Pomacea canaliculata TaxID=400727 RepID=A0A2T7NBK5_POMCA|nr:hypothetical protein C0Q70_21104 [Pomacea canaliculata]
MDNMTDCLHGWVSTSSPQDDVTSRALYQAGMTVWKVGSPVSIVLGTVGNILIFVVLYERNGTRGGMSVYFTVLAVTDLVGLYFNLVPRWIKFTFNFDIKALHIVICKLTFWIPYSASTMSTWTLVVMVTQRTLSVIWHSKITEIRVVHRCVQRLVLAGHGDILILPFIVLLVDDVILIGEVTRSTREARLRLAVGSQQQIKAREQKAMSMTTTLITTSFTFFIMTFPYYVVEALTMVMVDTLFADAAVFEVFVVTWSIFTFLWCSHHAVNFYLYCLTGSRFRAKAWKVLCGCKTGFTGAKSTPGASLREHAKSPRDENCQEEF